MDALPYLFIYLLILILFCRGGGGSESVFYATNNNSCLNSFVILLYANAPSESTYLTFKILLILSHPFFIHLSDNLANTFYCTKST